MITIFDVAKAAGVSKSTVSLVINNSPLVKEETRQRVQAVIKALHYVPNYNARGLTMKHNNIIVIVHTLRDKRYLDQHYEWNYGMGMFSQDVESGIFSALAETDADISVLKEHFDLSTGELPRVIRNNRADGAIFVGGFDNADVLKTLKSIEIPIVIVTSSLTIDGIDAVMHDPKEGSRIVFHKFAETGHKRICLVNCPKDFRVWPARIEGFEQGAQECGLALDQNLLISTERNTAESAYKAFSSLLDSGHMPDAVLTANNDSTMGVLRCLYERGINVPRDISVVSYEDSKLCGNMFPALTAVNIHKETIGRTALNLLMNRIEHPDSPARMIRIEPSLVLRSSIADRRGIVQS